MMKSALSGKPFAALTLAVLGALWLSGCQQSTAASKAPGSAAVAGAAIKAGAANTVGAASSAWLLTSKTPYQPQQDWHSYSAVPAGFTPVSIQHVARHGSRFLSDRSDDVLMLQLLALARQQQALTPLGERFAALMHRLHQAHQPNQYGEISQLGVAEHQGMAARLLARFPQLFSAAQQQRLRFAVLHSGRERADQSGEAFVGALLAAKPQLAPLFDAAKADPATLYFNKAEGSEGYERYRDEDPRLKAVLTQLASEPARQHSAAALLERLFSPAFVSQLAGGAIRLTVPNEDDEIASVADAAAVIYSLYSIASNLAGEGPFDFADLLLPEHLLPLAELDDAESFYGRGPGFAGEDITYRLAGRLVADMLQKAETPAGYLATFRFSHAQALIPLAAYLGIPGASEALPVEVAYSYQHSQWRSSRVSPMAANVQWEVYRDAGGTMLIRMLHNEQESQFKASCQPYGSHRYFYTLTELKRCLLPQRNG